MTVVGSSSSGRAWYGILMMALLVLACVSGAALPAADPPATMVYHNTICPVSGRPFDASVPPMSLTVKRNGQDTQVQLWVASEADREIVRAKPGPYLEMAALNRQLGVSAPKP